MAVAGFCAPKLPTPTALNVPPRNMRRFIESDLPWRQGQQKLNM
jgi:hypothetical protein